MITYHDLTSNIYGPMVPLYWLCDGVVTYIASAESEVSDCELMVGYYGN